MGKASGFRLHAPCSAGPVDEARGTRGRHTAPHLAKCGLAHRRAEALKLPNTQQPLSNCAQWEGLVEPLEKISDRHQRTWGVVSHLKASEHSYPWVHVTVTVWFATGAVGRGIAACHGLGAACRGAWVTHLSQPLLRCA